MNNKKIDNKLVIRLEKDEEIVTEVERILKDREITAGYFQGIGAVSKATLGHYSLVSKDYSEKELNQPLEIVSLMGTITKEGIHPHACLGTEDMETYGGHLVEGVVAATCEIIVTTVAAKLDRYHDEEIGLDLLNI